MEYSIINKGTGVVMIRLFIPEFQLGSFLSFIGQKSRESAPNTRKPSPLHDEDYLIKRDLMCATTYRAYFNSGKTKSQATSATLQTLKNGNYHTISYDSLKAILTRSGCFRLKNVN